MKQTAVEWLVHELDKQMIERDKFDAFEVLDHEGELV